MCIDHEFTINCLDIDFGGFDLILDCLWTLEHP
jgi:hypothetical protein